MITLEEKIYEFLGVKYFKKFVLSMGKSNRKNSNIPKKNNYFLHELSIDGINDFKKSGIKYNSIIHIVGLTFCLLSLTTATSTFSIIWRSILTAVNAYCVMLQRYNNIRLNRIKEKLKEREERIEKIDKGTFENNLKSTNKLDYKMTLDKNISSNSQIENLKNMREELLRKMQSKEINEKRGLIKHKKH